MSSELIERLRDYGLTLEPNVVFCDRTTVDEAAATIAALQAELAEAREVPGRIVAMIGRDFDAPHIIDVAQRIATAIEALWIK